MAKSSKARKHDTQILVVGVSPSDVATKKFEMEAQGFKGGEILWGEVTQEYYQWWYRELPAEETRISEHMGS